MRHGRRGHNVGLRRDYADMGDLDLSELPATPGGFDPDAFGELYCRHERSIAGYLMRRTGSAELAADLTAEVFAAALLAWRRRARPALDERAWLFGIAQHKLVDSYRRGRVEDDARRRLGMRATVVSDESLVQIEALTAETPALALIEQLPAEQRVAVTARVIDGRGYGEIASELRLSEQVVRKRVSRGLQRLRQLIGGGR
jgi:RNA polymerase sigma factor (sigma-70 family)